MCKHYQNPAGHDCELYSGEGLAVCSCWMGCSVSSFGRPWARIVSPDKQFLCQRLHQRFGGSCTTKSKIKSYFGSFKSYAIEVVSVIVVVRIPAWGRGPSAEVDSNGSAALSGGSTGVFENGPFILLQIIASHKWA